MEDRPAIPGSRGRCEPRRLTLADLLMLIVGFALAFSLPQLHHLDDALMMIGAVRIQMPGWSAHLLVLREVAMKCGMIVVPVIVARRARYGGLPHPADWLAILVALPWVHEAVERSGGIKRFARWYLVDLRSWLGFSVDVSRRGTSSGGGILVADLIDPGYDGFPTGFTPGSERPWGVFTAIVFFGLLTALGFGWRRIPAWAKTALLSAAAFTGLEAATIYLLPVARYRASQAIAGWFRLSPDIALLIGSGLYTLSDGLLLVVPFVAVLSALRTCARKSWAWTGWVGATAALLALAADLGYNGSDLPFGMDPVGWRRFAMLSLRLFVAGLASWIIVKCIGRADRPSDGS
jgi:hypothetical protein